MRRRLAGVLRRDRRDARQRPGRTDRHARTVRGGTARARRRTSGIATVHDSGAERALIADMAHELGVAFAALSTRHGRGHRCTARRRPDADQPAGRLGHRRRHPRPVRGVPARDGRRPCGRRSRRWRWTWSPNSTATPPMPTRCSTSRSRRTPAGGAGIGAVGGRPSDRAAAAGQRHSRAGRRTAAGSPRWRTWRTWPLPDRRRRRSSPTARRRRDWASRAVGFGLLADYGVPVVPTRIAATTARRRCAAARRSASPWCYENPWGRAQERRRRRGARHRRRGAVGCGVRRRWRGRLGPVGDRVRDGAAGVEMSVGVRPRRRVRSAGGGRRRRHAGRGARRPRGRPARRCRADGATRARSTRCGSGRFSPAGGGAPPADVEALADVVVAIATMAVELGEVFDAVEANPVIASATGRSRSTCSRSPGETLPATDMNSHQSA